MDSESMLEGRVRALERSLRWRTALMVVASAGAVVAAGGWKLDDVVEARQLVIHDARDSEVTIVVGPWKTANGTGIGIARLMNETVGIPADQVATHPPLTGQVWIPAYNVGDFGGSYLGATPILEIRPEAMVLDQNQRRINF